MKSHKYTFTAMTLSNTADTEIRYLEVLIAHYSNMAM